MPKGLIITEWSEDKGLFAKFSFPDTLIVDLDDMMRIFYAHITGAGEAGKVLVRLEKSRANVSSYFTGMESEVPYMINLMLDLGEDPEIFGEMIISQINQNILLYLKRMNQYPNEIYEINKELTNYVKNSLSFLERLKSLTKEQIMAQIYTSERGRVILEILQEFSLTKKELQNLLEIKTGRFIANLDNSLDPFVKTDLVRQDWIEGDSDISLFLLSDFIIMRSPANKLIEDAKKGLPNPYLARKYLESVTNFFSSYEVKFDDNLKIASHMINPDIFDYIILLREKPYPINKFPKGPGESFEQVKAFVNTLERDNVIVTLEGEDNMIWIFLLTDLIAKTFFPEYLIDNIGKAFAENKIKKKTAIKHLELLEQIYKK
ncbi:MAG: hypothetical protein ACFE9P_13505 [Candidatus Hermodarchaeota archaeon]